MVIDISKGKNLLVVSPVCKWKKMSLAKLCKCTKKLTSGPGFKVTIRKSSQKKKNNLKAHTCTVSLNQGDKQKGRLQRYMIRLTSCADTFTFTLLICKGGNHRADKMIKCLRKQ